MLVVPTDTPVVFTISTLFAASRETQLGAETEEYEIAVEPEIEQLNGREAFPVMFVTKVRKEAELQLNDISEFREEIEDNETLDSVYVVEVSGGDIVVKIWPFDKNVYE